jgi:hypothetical protein
MTLDELRQIENSAVDDESFVSTARHAIERISSLRRADAKVLGRVPFETGWNACIKEMPFLAEKHLKQVVTDLMPEILRLAEMRLEAEARTRQIRGKMRRQQLKVFLSDPTAAPEAPEPGPLDDILGEA